MITFEEAYEIVLSQIRFFGVESVPLLQSIGRVLQEDLTSDRDMPPFNRVMMDGIAIKHSSDGHDNQSFRIEGVGAAGKPQLTLEHHDGCFEIMTGAILPEGTDTVIRYEDLTIDNGIATVNTSFIKGQNIHRKGEDRKMGDVLLAKGKFIGSEDIGIAATVGKSDVLVSKLPKSLIISTGDELVELNETPLPYQIRKSNVYQIAATLQALGLDADTAHLVDEPGVIQRDLDRYLDEYDLIILSGGVSKGKFDFIPEILEKLGVEKLFHRVKQRPGKPFWFGKHANKCAVFALPGNPVSSYMCSQVYLKSWLIASLQMNSENKWLAELAEDVHFKPDLTYFLEVKTKTENGKLLAHPMKGNGSGDLSNLSRADAFIKLPSDKSTFQKGEVHLVYPFSRP